MKKTLFSVGTTLWLCLLAGCAGKKQSAPTALGSLPQGGTPTIAAVPTPSTQVTGQPTAPALAAAQGQQPGAAGHLATAKNWVNGAAGQIGNSLSFRPRTIASNDPLSLNNMPKKVSADLYLTAASLYEDRGNMPGAVQQYMKAIEAEPQNAKTWIRFGRMYDRHQDSAQALAAYQNALSVDPNNATAHNDMGLCLAKQGKVDDAVQSLNKAVQLQPTKVLYRNNLAMVLTSADREADALAQLASVYSQDKAQFNMAAILLKQNKHEQARHYLQMALQSNPQLKDAQALLASLSGQVPLASTPPAVPQQQPVLANNPQPPQAPTIPPSYQVQQQQRAMAPNFTQVSLPPTQNVTVPAQPAPGMPAVTNQQNVPAYTGPRTWDSPRRPQVPAPVVGQQMPPIAPTAPALRLPTAPMQPPMVAPQPNTAPPRGQINPQISVPQTRVYTPTPAAAAPVTPAYPLQNDTRPPAFPLPTAPTLPAGVGNQFALPPNAYTQ